VPSRKGRELRVPRRERVCSDEPVDPARFFGESDRARKESWKVWQLCKQVEHAVALTLAGECDGEALLGATVASVAPAPDAGRLRVTVVLPPGKPAGDAAEAQAALNRSIAAFRDEVARSIHRKRVPEIVFDVMLSEGGPRG
jgi:ribosome-binding factor A